MDLALIGCVVAEHRKACGWSQAQFAERIGKSATWVRNIESGGKVKEIRDLGRIATALGMSLVDLLIAAEPGGDSLGRLPKQGQALVLAVNSAAGRARTRPCDHSIDDLREAIGQAGKSHEAARPVDAAAKLACVIPALEHALAHARDPETPRDLLIDAYQAAAIALSQLGANVSARVAAQTAILTAVRADRSELAPNLTASCVLRRASRADEAALLAETVLRMVDTAANSGEQRARAARGAARLELAGIAALLGNRTAAGTHLEAAYTDAATFCSDTNLNGVCFGPTAVKLRHLDVAVRAADPDLALSIAQQVDLRCASALTRARVLIHTAIAYGLVGNIRCAARIIADLTTLTPQLKSDPAVRHLIHTLYNTNEDDRHQLDVLDAALFEGRKDKHKRSS